MGKNSMTTLLDSRLAGAKLHQRAGDPERFAPPATFSGNQQRQVRKTREQCAWLLRNLADAKDSMLRGCAIIHHLWFLQMIRLQTSPRVGYPFGPERCARGRLREGRLL